MLPAWQIAGRCGHGEVSKNDASSFMELCAALNINLFLKPLFSSYLDAISRATRSQHNKYT
jgi:hypothetical protein